MSGWSSSVNLLLLWARAVDVSETNFAAVRRKEQSGREWKTEHNEFYRSSISLIGTWRQRLGLKWG